MAGVQQGDRSGMTAEVYRRPDDKWGWRVFARNGQIVATDGSQGYVRWKRAVEMCERVTLLTPEVVG